MLRLVFSFFYVVWFENTLWRVYATCIYYVVAESKIKGEKEKESALKGGEDAAIHRRKERKKQRAHQERVQIQCEF